MNKVLQLKGNSAIDSIHKAMAYVADVSRNAKPHQIEFLETKSADAIKSIAESMRTKPVTVKYLMPDGNLRNSEDFVGRNPIAEIDTILNLFLKEVETITRVVEVYIEPIENHLDPQLRSENEDLRTRLGQANAMRMSLDQQIITLSDEVKNKNVHIAELEGKLSIANTAIRRNTAEITLLTQQLETLTRERDLLSDENNILKSNLEAVQRRFSDYETKAVSIETKLRETIANAEAKAAAINKELLLNTELAEQAVKRFNAKNAELKQLKQNTEAKDADIVRLDTELTTLQQRIQTLQSKNESMKAAATAHRSEMAEDAKRNAEQVAELKSALVSAAEQEAATMAEFKLKLAEMTEREVNQRKNAQLKLVEETAAASLIASNRTRQQILEQLQAIDEKKYPAENIKDMIDEIKNTFKEMREAHSQLTNDLTAMTEMATAATAANRTHTSEMSTLQRQLAEANANIKVLQLTVEEFEAKTRAAEDEIANLNAAITKLRQQPTGPSVAFKQQLVEKQETIERLEKTIERLEKTIQTVENKQNAAELKTLHNEVTELTSKLVDKSAEVNRLEMQLGTLQQQAGALDSVQVEDSHQYQFLVEKTDAKIIDLETQLADSQADQERLNTELKEMTELFNSVVESNNLLRKELLETRKKKKSFSDKLMKLTIEFEEYKAFVENAENEYKAAANERVRVLEESKARLEKVILTQTDLQQQLEVSQAALATAQQQLAEGKQRVDTEHTAAIAELKAKISQLKEINASETTVSERLTKQVVDLNTQVTQLIAYKAKAEIAELTLKSLIDKINESDELNNKMKQLGPELQTYWEAVKKIYHEMKSQNPNSTLDHISTRVTRGLIDENKDSVGLPPTLTQTSRALNEQHRLILTLQRDVARLESGNQLNTETVNLMYENLINNIKVAYENLTVAGQINDMLTRLFKSAYPTSTDTISYNSTNSTDTILKNDVHPLTAEERVKLFTATIVALANKLNEETNADAKQNDVIGAAEPIGGMLSTNSTAFSLLYYGLMALIIFALIVLIVYLFSSAYRKIELSTTYNDFNSQVPQHAHCRYAT